MINQDYQRGLAEGTKIADEKEKELIDLRGWKHGALKVMAKLDTQEAAKIMKLRLGDDIYENIIPWMKARAVKKVWVVSQGIHDDEEMVGVFSSLKLAKECVVSSNASLPDEMKDTEVRLSAYGAKIEEWTLDSPKD